MSSESYSISQDKLILQDAELGLDLVLPFLMPRLPQDLTAPKVLEPGVLLVVERDRESSLRAAYLTQEGKRHGQCRLFFSEGNLQAEMFYLQGKLHGPSCFYGDKGELLSQMFFCEGKRIGKGYLYFLSGNKASIQRFKEGEWDGLQEYYYESGCVKSHLPYVSGKLHGQVRLYWENGQIKRQTDYSQGLREGKDEIWNEQGVLVDSGEYQAGHPCGVHRHFFANGSPKEEIVYHTPLRFDKKEWDANGKLKVEALWAPDLTYTEKVYQETHGALVRKGYWDGTRLCWK